MKVSSSASSTSRAKSSQPALPHAWNHGSAAGIDVWWSGGVAGPLVAMTRGLCVTFTSPFTVHSEANGQTPAQTPCTSTQTPFSRLSTHYMSTLPTRSVAHAYITEHGLREYLEPRGQRLRPCQRGRSDRLHHRAPESGEGGGKQFNGRAEEKEATTTTVVPAVTSEFDKELFTAAMYGDLAEVEALLAKGAECEGGGQGWRGPRCTVRRGSGHTAIVDALLAQGAEPKAVDNDGLPRCTMRR